MKLNRQANIAKMARWTARGVLGVAVLLLGIAGCSSGLEECSPPVPPGTRYKVTVIGETTASERCHISTLQPTFEITAARKGANTQSSMCSLTPADWAPQQQGLQVVNCTPSEAQMLGTTCSMKYPGTCPGMVDFYFYEPAGAQVDWGAATINNVVFRIEDSHLDCIPNIANCLDEYAVRLDRIQ